MTPFIRSSRKPPSKSNFPTITQRHAAWSHSNRGPLLNKWDHCYNRVIQLISFGQLDAGTAAEMEYRVYLSCIVTQNPIAHCSSCSSNPFISLCARFRNGSAEHVLINFHFSCLLSEPVIENGGFVRLSCVRNHLLYSSG